MGCDIHYVVEEPMEDSGWIGIMSTEAPFAPPFEIRRKIPLWQFIDRDYAFFAALAGVRGDGPKPLGLPSDASEMTRYYAEGSDGHSHSHCSLREFAALKALVGVDFTEQQADTIIDNEDSRYLRVCFWFDN